MNTATISETILAKWAASHGLDLEKYWEANNEGRRQMIKDLASPSGDYYKKGKSENFQRLMDRDGLWKDVDIIVNERAEETTVTPKLNLAEQAIGAVNTRRELTEAQERLNEIPKEKLTGERVERFDRLQTTFTTAQTVMDQMEAEAAMLGRQEFVTSEEAKERNINYMMGQAREQGITTAGGRVVQESRVRYRTDAPQHPFIVRQYDIRYNEQTGELNERPVYRVWRQDTGEYIGQFSEKPSAKQIREKWRG